MGSRSQPGAEATAERPPPRRPASGYADEPVPLAGYGLLVAGFGTLVAGGALAARRAGIRLPERIAAADVAYVGVATFKLARLVSKDRVASFARAPFTEFQEGAGRAELVERPRGTGLRRAVGELVICPYCLGVWVGAAFTGGLIAAPRATRAVAAACTVVAISDALQMVDRAAAKRLLGR